MGDDRRDDAPPPGEERSHRAERSERRPPSLRGLARRLLFDEQPPPHVPSEDEPDLDPEEQRRRLEARAILAALLETGDKAKTETIKMVAREVRGYLEALELHKDLNHLLTNYSLEVKASIHLAPLAPAQEDAEPREPSAGSSGSVGLKRRTPRPPDEPR